VGLVIRLGSVKATADRMAALVRGVRDNLAGNRRAVIDMDARSDGDSNTRVFGSLAARNPRLVAGLDAPVRAAVKARWDQGGVRTGLAELAFYAGRALAFELAARLRSGRFVTNTPATTERKRALGRSTTPGMETGALAVALDNARVSVE
jgi:hypothetical protein